MALKTFQYTNPSLLFFVMDTSSKCFYTFNAQPLGPETGLVASMNI